MRGVRRRPGKSPPLNVTLPIASSNQSFSSSSTRDSRLLLQVSHIHVITVPPRSPCGTCSRVSFLVDPQIEQNAEVVNLRHPEHVHPHRLGVVVSEQPEG